MSQARSASVIVAAVAVLVPVLAPQSLRSRRTSHGWCLAVHGLQEQLGLTVEAARGPVEILAIHHIERPTDN